MKRKKILKYFLIVAVLLIIFAFVGKRVGWFGKSKIYKVSCEKAEMRTIVETITANGKVQPETEVKISPDVSGEIVELYINEGDEVNKGDILLKIKPDIYLSNLDRVKASLNSAKAQLSQAEAQFIDKENSYNRSKILWDKKAISKSEFETAEAAWKIAKANVDAAKFSIKSAEASLKEARENLIKTSIYAPMSGTISMLNVEKGERVVGTAQFTGTELLRIANLNLMEVKVDVNENDIVRVSLGDTSVIEIDAYIEHKFKGIVTEIANSANITGITTDQVTSFDVKIHILQDSYKNLIENSDSIAKIYYPFRPGMSATVDIQTHTKLNALSIPIQSVTTRTDTSDAFAMSNSNEDNTDEPVKEIVFMYKDGKVYSKEVTTGIQDNNYIEVLTGLTKEDEVVVAPYSAISKKLKDAMEVSKVKKEDLFEEKK